MKKVLIVEDSEDVRENLSDLLEMNNYQVISSSNGYDGFKSAIKFSPDLIIADIMMPTMDGMEMLKLLKENSITEDIPLIFLTAKSSMEDIRNGMNWGADDYLPKPFSSAELLNSVRIRLRKKENIERKFEKIYQNISTYIPHELRTPLLPILGLSSIVLDEIDSLSKAEIRDMMLRIKYSAGRLHNKIEKFILFSESEMILNNRKKYQSLLFSDTEMQEYIVDYLIMEKMRSVETLLPAKISIAPAQLKISEEHLKMILSELIENSIKYSCPEHSIEVISTEDEKKYILSIKNCGGNYSLDELNEFTNSSKRRNKKLNYSGKGLGLKIVKRLSDFYGVDFRIAIEPEDCIAAYLTFNKISNL